MKLFVRFGVFDTITRDADVSHLRQVFGEQVQRIIASGKMEAGGIFADARAGYLILNIDSPEELMDLLGGAMIDHCRVETHPLMSFEKLAEFFQKEAEG